MGVAYMMSPCFACRRVFCYNPVRVPSLPANVSPTGTREPICQACVDRANPERIARGLDPIVPHPDAYSPIDEQDLP